MDLHHTFLLLPVIGPSFSAWDAVHEPPAPPSPYWRLAPVPCVHVSLLIFLKDKHDPVTSAFRTFKCLLESIQQILNCANIVMHLPVLGM